MDTFKVPSLKWTGTPKWMGTLKRDGYTLNGWIHPSIPKFYRSSRGQENLETTHSKQYFQICKQKISATDIKTIDRKPIKGKSLHPKKPKNNGRQKE